MFDLIIRGALVVDPLNKINAIKDVAVAEGKITAIEDEISLPAKKLIEASGKVLIPGIIDMHTHMRTVLGHKRCQQCNPGRCQSRTDTNLVPSISAGTSRLPG